MENTSKRPRPVHQGQPRPFDIQVKMSQEKQLYAGHCAWKICTMRPRAIHQSQKKSSYTWHCPIHPGQRSPFDIQVKFLYNWPRPVQQGQPSPRDIQNRFSLEKLPYTSNGAWKGFCMQPRAVHQGQPGPFEIRARLDLQCSFIPLRPAKSVWHPGQVEPGNAAG